MENLNKKNRANIWLLLCIALYFVMNGAQFWETAIMVPAWTKAPPASLIFFQGEYGLDFKAFWIIIHSFHDLVFIVALVLNWNIGKRRIPMLLLFIMHMGIRIWTIAYFAPILIEFQQIPVTNAVEEVLVNKAAQWRNLNYLRVGLFVAVNIALCFLPNDQFNQYEK